MDGWPFTGGFCLALLVEAAPSAGDATLGIWATLKACDQLLCAKGRAMLIQRLRFACQEKCQSQE